jgi:hypothetical protein
VCRNRAAASFFVACSGDFAMFEPGIPAGPLSRRSAAHRVPLCLGLAIAAWLGSAFSAAAISAAPPGEPSAGAFLDAPPRPEGDHYSTDLGGKAKVSLFGTVGEGYKFVYCFDRSGSMGGARRSALGAVQAELRESFKPLDSIHQFQIIFYNERPVVFNPTGTPGRLAFANEQNKARALRFLESIVADGGTDHEEALKLAIRMQPDVIFFLTDGDDPKLTAAEIDEITYRAGGIRINTIQFASGPQPAGTNFLMELARQNGGQYRYVDITKLRLLEKK